MKKYSNQNKNDKPKKIDYRLSGIKRDMTILLFSNKFWRSKQERRLFSKAVSVLFSSHKNSFSHTKLQKEKTIFGCRLLSLSPQMKLENTERILIVYWCRRQNILGFFFPQFFPFYYFLFFSALALCGGEKLIPQILSCIIYLSTIRLEERVSKKNNWVWKKITASHKELKTRNQTTRFGECSEQN